MTAGGREFQVAGAAQIYVSASERHIEKRNGRWLQWPRCALVYWLKYARLSVTIQLTLTRHT